MQRYIANLYRFIIKQVPEKASVLDLGCGEGTLLQLLVQKKKVKATGIDFSSKDLNKALAKGLSVLQADLDKGLENYQNNFFDYVVLSHTLQVLQKPALVINEMLRVGKKGIVTFPNFGHWAIRLSFLLRGRMPKSKMLPFEWYNTPNIHLLTIRDFKRYCKKRNIKIIKSYNFNTFSLPVPALFANLLATHAVFVIKK